MLSNISQIGPFISHDAERFINEHALDGMVMATAQALTQLAEKGAPIQTVRISLADDWDDDDTRLLFTVWLGSDIVQAFHAWREVRPVLSPIVANAERDGFVEFEFAPARQ